MKTKKSILEEITEFILVYGWAILATITAIAVLVYFGVYSPNQDFVKNITKEECWNETLYDFEIRVYDRDCVEIQEIGSRNEYFISYKPQTTQLFCDNYKDYGIGYDFGMKVIPKVYNILKAKQVCNKVEVDEIRIYGNEITKLRPGQSLDYDTRLNKCFDKIDIIPKEDLTKEFLDEQTNLGNCECIKCEALNPEKEWGWESVKDGDKIIQCSKRCLNYKCQFGKENYFVEVR